MNIKYFLVAAAGITFAAVNANAQAPEPAIEATEPPIIERMPIPPVPDDTTAVPAPEPPTAPMAPETPAEDGSTAVSEPVPEPMVPVPAMESPAPIEEMEAPAPEPEPAVEVEIKVSDEEPAATTGSSDYDYSWQPRSSKSVVEAKGVVEAPAITMEEPLGITLSGGYMSKYVFYGADFGDNGIWTGIDYTLTEGPVPIDVGAWYINVMDPNEQGPEDELDLYVSVGGPTVLGFDTNLIYTAFFYPEGPWGAAQELAAGFGRDLFGFANWQTSAHYDFDLDGWYFESALSKKIPLTDIFSLSLSTGVSYQIDYNEIDGRWNHFFVMASLPISLRSNVVIEPYIGHVVTLDALRYIDRTFLHGGISISVSF